MSIRIFLSSEMATQEDKKRRESAFKEITEMGHIPVIFEALPARPFLENQKAIDKCKELVSTSDILLAIIDDTISQGMAVELTEALRILGKKKIIYYFTRDGKRDQIACQLWERSKDVYCLGEFSSISELRKQIKRTIGSYLEDVLIQIKKSHKQIITKEITLGSARESHEEYEFNEGDVVTITCLGNGAFYCGFFNREKYIKLRSAGDFNWFGFEPGTDKNEHTMKITVSEKDDYYLVLRRSAWQDDPVTIKVKIKCEKNE